MKNTKDTLPHFRTLKTIFNGLITFRVYLVGDEIGRIEKERRKNMREICWEKCLVGRGRKEFWWGLGVFSPSPPKHRGCLVCTFK